jgi:cytochrome c peroxidase
MALGIAFLLGVTSPAAAANLNLQVDPRFNGSPLAFDSPTNLTLAGQRVSLTRLDFLLSDLALRRPDGTWIEQTNWFAYLSMREGRTNAPADGVPPGNYDRIRFFVGLSPEVNHHATAGYPAGHPLNPNVDGLYWGWNGGYVFMAVEGNWLQPSGKQSGYSYHVANDWELMAVELPVPLHVTGDCQVHLLLNVDQIFDGPHPLTINTETATTHSRTNDIIADNLSENISSAFSADQVTPAGLADALRHGTNHVVVAADATNYRLTFSAFFPRPALPLDNPLTEEGVALGRRLFSDKRLSINGTQSCASCHQPGQAFTDGKSVSTGAEGKSGTRNAMALFNLAWKSSFFWDGRAASIREQVLQPIQNPIEMHESLTNVVAKLAADPDYPKDFARAFGTPQITADVMARALEQFLLTEVSYNSKFDRMLLGEAKFTPEEQRGLQLFQTEYDPRHGQFGADCFHCHGGALFQSQGFANNGLDETFADLGRFKVTNRKGDEGKFAVPTLRNVELTAPYMHDGRFQTLDEVVEHYCTGMKRSATLDPNLGKHPDGGLPLSDSDKHALVAFMKTLTDQRFIADTNAAVAQVH